MAVKIAETKPKSNLVGCTPLTFIYKIMLGKNKEIVYVGCTNNPDKRFSQHQSELINGKHSNKALQKKYTFADDQELTFEIIIGIPSNSTTLKFFLECLAISYYGDRIVNRPHIQIGRMKCNLIPCDSALAKILLEDVAEFFDVPLNL